MNQMPNPTHVTNPHRRHQLLADPHHMPSVPVTRTAQTVDTSQLATPASELPHHQMNGTAAHAAVTRYHNTAGVDTTSVSPGDNSPARNHR